MERSSFPTVWLVDERQAVPSLTLIQAAQRRSVVGVSSALAY
jgi:hypothetical protein